MNRAYHVVPVTVRDTATHPADPDVAVHVLVQVSVWDRVEIDPPTDGYVGQIGSQNVHPLAGRQQARAF